MYNNNSNNHNSENPKTTCNNINNPPMNNNSPRISFSHDLTTPIIKPTRDYNTPPVFSDFEFSFSNNNMMPADELFFKGRLLPFKESAGNASGSVVGQKTTLRDELLAGEDDACVSLKPPKGGRWKGFLGLRKSSIGSRKSDKVDGSKSGFGSGSGLGQDDNGHASKASQEMKKYSRIADVKKNNIEEGVILALLNYSSGSDDMFDLSPYSEESKDEENSRTSFSQAGEDDAGTLDRNINLVEYLEF
uniref:Uncharacterized protein n=1 Tax=Tanacetum cinerariifolium TaxID=118510 RepID=A0A699ICY2_TANCI|nr:hypothetical protein [Tanacetum cinerariifolium]